MQNYPKKYTAGRKNALKCKNNGGNTPLGYVVGTDGALAIDPLAAPQPFKIGGVSFLKNREYIGEYKYGDMITLHGIPAIVGRDLFDRVQQRIGKNRQAPAKAKAWEEYMPTTKQFCGICGRLMAGESGVSSTAKTAIYRYYKCSGAKRHLGCKRKAIRKD